MLPFNGCFCLFGASNHEPEVHLVTISTNSTRRFFARPSSVLTDSREFWKYWFALAILGTGQAVPGMGSVCLQRKGQLLLPGPDVLSFFQPERYRQRPNRVFEALFGSIRIRIVREDGPDEPCRRIDGQSPAMMANPSAQIFAGDFNALLANNHTSAGACLQIFAGFQAKLESQFGILRRCSLTGDREAENQFRRQRGVDIEIGKKRVVGQRQPVFLRFHLKAAGYRYVGADEGGMVPGEIDPLLRFGNQKNEVLFMMRLRILMTSLLDSFR